MEEYISRDDAVRAVEMQCVDGKMFGTDESDMTLVDADDVAQSISEIPAADVAPVRHGRWYPQEYTVHCGCGKSYGDTKFRCSVCNRIANWNPYGLKYCPNCGAKMDFEDIDGQSQ